MFDVIVVTYKVSPEFITRCLDSILSQTFSDYHVYICDGTPEDYEGYTDIMKTFDNYTTDSRFTLLQQTGRGVSQARNQAIAAGNRPYIATLDGDDLWYPEHLEWMTEAIESTQSEQLPVAFWWAGADAEIKLQSLKTDEVYSKMGVIGWYPQWAETLDPSETFFFCFGNPLMPSNSAMLRSRYEAIGGYDETLQIGEDTDLFIRMAGNPIKYAPNSNNLGTELFYGHQIDAVSGYHGCGPWQTTTMGHQSSAAENRSFQEVQAEFQRQTDSRILKSYWFSESDRPSWIDSERWTLLCEIAFQKSNDVEILNLKAEV